ncbi:BPI fold-containing family B member 2-like isoform X2 [Hyperolius riggenbachi]|uniref:BPI fold-containing family B member 2-like isoform X2 n=1 Tax=Hyperolius riggenbachi TaxID=752182 RepID=UPI0035A37C9B
MKLLFITALLVVWISPMRGTPCKTVLRVKQEAMEYACQTQRRPLQQAFGIISIPSVIQGTGGGIFGLGLVDKAMKLAGIQILEVKLPELNVKLVPNVGLQVSIDTHFHISGNLAIAGNIEIKAGAGVVADMKVSRAAKGFPLLSVSACKSVLGEIKVTAGGFGVLNVIANAVKGHIEAILRDRLCVSVSNVFLDFNANLGMLVGVAAIGEGLGLQYTIPSPPVVTGDYMDFDMNVEYQVEEKTVVIPNGAKDFTLPPTAGNKDSMVNMGFSADFFISMFTAFQSSGGFNMEIPSTSASVGSYLRTSLLGSYITEINKRYKEALPVYMKIVLSQTPIVTLQANQLLIQISPYVELFVVTPNMRLQHLMTLNVGATLIGKLDVKGGKIKASVALGGDLNIAIASSSFGSCGCKPSVLNGYMRDIFEKAYLLELNAALSVGVSLPSLPNVQVIHEVIEVQEKYVVMSGDVIYTK